MSGTWHSPPGDRHPRPLGYRTRVVQASVIGAILFLETASFGAQAQATPEAASTATSVVAKPATPEFWPDAPHMQVIAQGVVNVDGPIIWRIRERVASEGDAPESPPTSFVLQRTGAAIIRNELTGRRIRLEPGEATFLPERDPVLRTAVGADPSQQWVIEFLPADTADGNAFLTGTQLFVSDATNSYPHGSFELELTRDVLLPAEVSRVSLSTGPALLLITSGHIEVTLEDSQVFLMRAGDSRLVTGRPFLRNVDSQAAVTVVAALREPMTDREVLSNAAQETPIPAPPEVTSAILPPIEAPAVQPQPAPVAAPSPAPTDTSWSDSATLDSDGDQIADIDELTIYGTDPYAWDTDGDGLGDGEEVFGYGTDPLLWDTDGDGISDGEEVHIYGTDPHDPTSGP